MPDIEEGTYALSNVIVTPASAINSEITYSSSKNRLYFKGSEDLKLRRRVYLIRVELVNTNGDEVLYLQTVNISKSEQ